MQCGEKSVVPAIGSDVRGYKILKVLSNTQNSVVFMANNKEKNKDVALKFIDCRNKNMNRLNDEIFLMEHVDCPYIVTALDVFDYPPYKCIVMPLGITDLQKMAAQSSNKKLPESTAKSAIYSILKALQYLHSHNICHRDLKPDNILVVNNGDSTEFKLCDLGFAKEIHDGELCNEYLGTLPYASPEMIAGVPYDISVDVWSLGVTLYVLLCGESPFPKNERSMRTCIVSGAFFFPANHWVGISREAKDLVSHMMKKKASLRYTIDQCLAHPWFADLNVQRNIKSIYRMPMIQKSLELPKTSALLV